MDEEIEVLDEEVDVPFPPLTLWVPANPNEALRWDCLMAASKLVPGKEVVKLARTFEIYILEGKAGPAAITTKE